MLPEAAQPKAKAQPAPAGRIQLVTNSDEWNQTLEAFRGMGINLDQNGLSERQKRRTMAALNMPDSEEDEVDYSPDTSMADAEPPQEVVPMPDADPKVKPEPAVQPGLGATAVEGGAKDEAERSKASLKRERKKLAAAAAAKGVGKGDDEGPPVKKEKDAASSSSGVSKNTPAVKAEPQAKPAVKVQPGLGATLAAGGAEGKAEASIPDRYKGTKEKPEEGSSFQCKECQLWVRGMKNIFSEKIQKHYQEYKDDAPDAWEVVNTCLACLVKTGNMSVGEALTTIKAQAIKPENARIEKYKANKAAVIESYQAICSALGKDKLSSKQVRTLSIVDFTKIFTPWAALIALKARSLEAAGEVLVKFNDATAKLSHLVNSNAPPSEIDKAMKVVDTLEEAIKKATELLAWKSRDDQQVDYITVCTYADEWIRYAGYQIRSYYVCTCKAVIPSKVWDRKHQDPRASKQAWYCVSCGRKYRASWGQVVEILDPSGNLMWLPADVPSIDVEDVRAMAIEQEQSNHVTTPMQLWDRIASHAPACGNGVVRPATLADVSWQNAGKSKEEVEEIMKSCAFITDEGKRMLDVAPKLSWMQLFNWVKGA